MAGLTERIDKDGGMNCRIRVYRIIINNNFIDFSGFALNRLMSDGPVWVSRLTSEKLPGRLDERPF